MGADVSCTRNELSFSRADLTCSAREICECNPKVMCEGERRALICQGAPKVMEEVERTAPTGGARITIAVVRHGERLDAVNPKKWYKSQAAASYPFDCPLTPLGKEQASRVAQDLLHHCPDEFALVVSSPYVRCVGTAVQIARALKVPICFDAELGEVYGPMCMGEWDAPGPPRRSLQEVTRFVPPDVRVVGLSADDLEHEYGDDAGGFIGEAPQWPESLRRARLRMASRVEQHTARAVRLGGMNMVLVTHGDCVHTALTLALASARKDSSNIPTMRVQTVSYCAFAILQRNCEFCEQPVGLIDAHAGWKVAYGNVGMVDRSTIYDPNPQLVKHEEETLKEEERLLKLMREKHADKLRPSFTLMKGALNGMPQNSLLRPGTSDPFLVSSAAQAEEFEDDNPLESLGNVATVEPRFDSRMLSELQDGVNLTDEFQQGNHIGLQPSPFADAVIKPLSGPGDVEINQPPAYPVFVEDLGQPLSYDVLVGEDVVSYVAVPLHLPGDGPAPSQIPRAVPIKIKKMPQSAGQPVPTLDVVADPNMSMPSSKPKNRIDKPLRVCSL